MVVRFALDKNLHELAGGQNLSMIVFNLLIWAEQHNQIERLIEGAWSQNRDNPALRSLHAEIEARKAEAKRFMISGREFHVKQDYVRAIADKTKAIELCLDNAAYYHSRGVSYHEAARAKHPSGDLTRAIADYSKAIELDPGNAKYYQSRAMCYHYAANTKYLSYLSGDFARAAADYSRAIELAPDNWVLYYHRASCLERMGRKKEAQQDWETYSRLSPHTKIQ